MALEFSQMGTIKLRFGSEEGRFERIRWILPCHETYLSKPSLMLVGLSWSPS
jgi:hypothetical protein